MDIREKHEKLLYPATRVRTEKAGGSGTVIYSEAVPDNGDVHETYVLTNHHVIESCIVVGKRWSGLLKREVMGDILSECDVEFFDFEYESWEGGSRKLKAQIMAYDKEMDLGLLRLKTSKPIEYVARLFPKDQHREKLRRWQEVVAVGCGMGHPPIHTTGHLNGFDDIIDNYPYILSSAPTIFGNSGGSLYVMPDGGLIDDAYLIGVPSRIAVAILGFGADAITHMSYAIPVWSIYQFLDDQIFDFIYRDDRNSKECAEERKAKRERDEKLMAVDMTRNGEDKS
jgi:S1-C subfamily serine protease